MGGLKSEISVDIRMFKPRMLKDAISLAHMKDKQLRQQRKVGRPPLSNRSMLTSSQPAKSTPPSTIKRLSWEEMQRRRAQGLCFNCNEKFTAGHKCREHQLMLLENYVNFEDRFQEDKGGKEKIDEARDGIEEPEISLHALTGWSTPRTMRVKIQIGKQELMALIDSGSTHNFINSKMADKL